MGFKKILGKAGKFAGKAVLAQAGLIDGGREFRLTPELREDLAEVVASGVYAALEEFYRPGAAGAGGDDGSSGSA